MMFGTKEQNQITLCDYCQYYKCKWIEATPKKLPDHCPEVRAFKMADEFIDKVEFSKRVGVAKRVGRYDPEGRVWFLSLTAAKRWTYRALEEIFSEINSWSVENKFVLNDGVRYKRKEFEF